MAILGMLLFMVGMVIALVGGIWLLIIAFQDSILWGLGCLFIPCVSLFFVATHWQKAGKPFLINLGGAIIMAIGSVMMGPDQQPVQM